MDAHRKNILLVDDDPDDLDLYVDLFKAIDPNIVTLKFLDPVEALTYLRTSTQLPELVILDFNMPKLTGLDFLKVIRGDEKLGRLRVVVITTGCGPREASALLDLGAECHRKAPRFDDFKALLERILSRSS